MQSPRLDTFYLLWSPNSPSHEFYPGYIRVLPSPYDGRESRYIDGRTGPDDWSLHPQHFSAERPWLPFCQAPTLVTDRVDELSPERVPLPAVWVPSGNGLGTFDKGFVDRLRARIGRLREEIDAWRSKLEKDDPHLHGLIKNHFRYPLPRHADHFEKYHKWSSILSWAARVQSSICEMAAFLEMVKYWPRRKTVEASGGMVQCSRFSWDPTRINRVQTRVGCWLNGASAEDAAWLLAIDEVPIYIIHKWQNPQDRSPNVRHFRKAVKLYSNFVDGTPAASWNGPNNPYRQMGPSTKDLRFTRSDLPVWTAIEPTPTAERRSAPWVGQLQLAEPPSPTPGAPNDHPKHVPLPTVSMPSSSSTSVSTATSSPNLPLPSSSTDSPRRRPSELWSGSRAWGNDVLQADTPLPWESSYQRPPPPPPPSRPPPPGQLIVQGGTSFWLPPPVHPGPPSRTTYGKKKKSKTSWISFRETEDHFRYQFPKGNAPPPGKSFMIFCAGKKRFDEYYEDDEDDDMPRQQGPRECYDRHGGRRLTFLRQVPEAPDVYFDRTVYGFPIPNHLTFWIAEGDVAKPCGRSHWAYFAARPDHGHTGLSMNLENCKPPLSLKPSDAAAGEPTVFLHGSRSTHRILEQNCREAGVGERPWPHPINPSSSSTSTLSSKSTPRRSSSPATSPVSRSPIEPLLEDISRSTHRTLEQTCRTSPVSCSPIEPFLEDKSGSASPLPSDLSIKDATPPVPASVRDMPREQVMQLTLGAEVSPINLDDCADIMITDVQPMEIDTSEMPTEMPMSDLSSETGAQANHPPSPRSFSTVRPVSSPYIYIDSRLQSCSEVLDLLKPHWPSNSSFDANLLSVVRDIVPASSSNAARGFVIRLAHVFDAIRIQPLLAQSDVLSSAQLITDEEASIILIESDQQWHRQGQGLSSAYKPGFVEKLGRRRGGIRDNLQRRFGRDFWDIVNDPREDEIQQCSAAELKYMNEKREERRRKAAKAILRQVDNGR
ncbi:hypothetical protein CC2G_008291 [Coprinopsis cinerea AmutBmut pab1-1]|nr:hypothetical protein CC2G_008291 [Coprinopsis cinerea AmutBmut pab1-1]